MKHILFIIIFLTTVAINAYTQGCVAIRGNGGSCSLAKPGSEKGWTFNFNNRYFRSYKHFVGTDEQKHRTDQGTEVINYSFSWDFSFTRNLNKFWSITMGIPINSNVRSSMYEHYGNSSTNSNARNNTSSFGLGDLRIIANRWLFDPVHSHNGNIQIGLGVKLPSGDYQYQDYFFKNDSTSLLGPVDQSIQLGDGGTGIITEVNAFYTVSHRVGVYANFYYLINPREQNGVSTSRGGSTSSTSSKYFTSTMSVPDQYMARGGISYMFNKFTFSGGARIECIPSSDLIGGDKGFRRPGYVISVEPVITYQLKKANIYLSVPVALKRNRTQSYSDKLRSKDDGIKRQGDAAFSDYFISAGASFRL